MLANPRRSSYSNTPNSENPFHTQIPYISSIKQFLKKPHAFPFLLSIFLFLTWVSLRIQHSSQLSTPHFHRTHEKWSKEDDQKVNLVRFSTGFPSKIAKDKRGWLLDPVSIALDSGISGGAITCASVHLGEIQPGGLRGNHRHYDCNETFVIWGAKTRFRLENSEVAVKGYAEVIIGEGEVAVAASPRGHCNAEIKSIIRV
ncbi:RmlC-type cupin [Quillaja saponaria]|uniref:RmlC-type cupin n=1 Tax=Quillaja saponaria TaxID=32244 RepID=A0AAD7PZF6_QUISA|nr:RmlC-type cupin [Quillaja saponaria]